MDESMQVKGMRGMYDFFFSFSLSPRHASVCVVVKISQMTPLLLRRVLSKVILPLSVCSRRNIPVYKTIR